jgi:hypothetical protein
VSSTIPIQLFGRRAAERPKLTSWVREWLQRRRLDRKLAAGADPQADQALTLHARLLLAPRTRARIADGLASAWRDASGPRVLSAKVPLAKSAILAAGPEFNSLIAELRADDSCRARGVAMARLLLIDADSPLYAPGSTAELSNALTRAYRALRLGDSD